ncbi:hypothetical protein CCR75_009176 [Bremia lactucae]|uniref:Tim44-like domain-containing protein n=1 Tax=Bremia lactucae TaxID=4779 RepID=A0A976IEC5_BRELC|nr:hypothetical protein CCR75_009176 [Bremia lactucae]
MLGLSKRMVRCVPLAPLRVGEVERMRKMMHLRLQRCTLSVFTDQKVHFMSEVEKHRELKNSIQELERSKQQLLYAEKIANENINSLTDGMAKQFSNKASQVSQKLMESYGETSKIHAVAGKVKNTVKMAPDTDASRSDGVKGTKQNEANTEDSEQFKQSDDTIQDARAFVNNFISAIVAQKNKLFHFNNLPKVRDEWMEAVHELFGKRDEKTVDEALASVRTPSMQKPNKKSGGDKEQYKGTSALVAVKGEESAWQRVSARFREAPIIQGILDAAKQAVKTEAGKKVWQTTKQVKDKISDAQEEVLEVWETSQNPWVYRLSSIYDGLFGETSMGVAIKEIRRAEPNFILEEWKESVEEVVLPGVLEAFLRGNSRDIKKWFGEAAYSRVNIAIRERKSEGLVMDPHVLSIDNVEVIEATADDKQAPIILMRFRAQQINCIHNREGDVVEGSEDEVLAYYYIFAFQRDYDEEQETLRWKIVDLHMQRGERYY